MQTTVLVREAAEGPSWEEVADVMSENMQFVKLAGMPQYIRYLAIEIFSNWLSSLLGKQSQVSVKYQLSMSSVLVEIGVGSLVACTH